VRGGRGSVWPGKGGISLAQTAASLEGADAPARELPEALTGGRLPWPRVGIMLGERKARERAAPMAAARARKREARDGTLRRAEGLLEGSGVWRELLVAC
jgi:hypothetical protein